MADVKIYTATKTDEVIAQAINNKGLNSVVKDVAVTEDGTGIKVVRSNGTETVVNFPAGGSVEGGLTQADIDSAIDALNLEQYALKSDIPDPQDLAGGVDEAEVRAIVEGMDLGSGSGVREVSGTVTLTTTDGPLVQVYATSSATVNSESLSTGDYAAFRLIGSMWEVRVLDKDAAWRVVGTDPTPVDPGDPVPAEPVPVTASVPVADDAANTWTWTPTEGVRYLIDGVERTGGTYSVGDVTKISTVTAEALPGYYLMSKIEVSHQFTGSVSVYQQAVMADDPLYLWMLDDAPGTSAPANLGSGTTALTVAGTSGYTFGVPGIGAGATALQHDGVGDHKLALPIDYFGGKAAWTVECLVSVSTTKEAGDPASANLVHQAGTTGATVYYSGGTSQRRFVATHRANTPSFVRASVMTSQGSYSTGIYHVAMVYDGTSLSIFVDGAQVATTSSYDTTTPGGGTSLVNVAFGRGTFAGVAIYETALSQARILAHAQAAGLA